MRTALFDFDLPAGLIAQRPADRRDDSRLLVVHRATRKLEHRHFRDLPEFLRHGDRLFRNNAAVIPARLRAQRPTGGQVECLLLRPAATSPEAGIAKEWWCLVRPGKKLPVGATFGATGLFVGTVREKTAEGLARVSFAVDGTDILAIANKIGEMPLPPYIAARTTDAERLLDRNRYQTVYANSSRQVAAAAPTAGLHFTPEVLAQASARGIDWFDLTLHVGLGTFRPITTDDVEDHAIHREIYEMPAATQRALISPLARRIAVGTTSVRSIEDFLGRNPDAAMATADQPTTDFIGEAGIFIRPPYAFRGVDALITNFHQPRSTLLCLVAAFLAPGSIDGIAWLQEIYAGAIAREYRFFSYGDAMLVL